MQNLAVVARTMCMHASCTVRCLQEGRIGDNNCWFPLGASRAVCAVLSDGFLAAGPWAWPSVVVDSSVFGFALVDSTVFGFAPVRGGWLLAWSHPLSLSQTLRLSLALNCP